VSGSRARPTNPFKSIRSRVAILKQTSMKQQRSREINKKFKLHPQH
jgi:hypothetical protein